MNIAQIIAASIDAGAVGVPKIGGDMLVTSVINLVYFFFAVAAVISIIISGILYAVSAGDSSKVQQAKNGILYGIIGLVIALLAFVITSFIVGRFSI